MNRLPIKERKRSRAYISVLLSALICLSACTDNAPQVLRIEGLELIVTDQNDKCTASKSAPSMLLSAGVMDIRFADSYTVFPVVHNVLSSSVQLVKNEFHVENHNMYIVGVTLEYTTNNSAIGNLLAEGPLQAGRFVHHTSFLKPEEVVIFPMEAIPTSLGQEIKQLQVNSPDEWPLFQSTEILVHMTIEAQLLDGKTIKSNEYILPLKICSGCLLQTPPQGNCCNSTGTFDYPCRFGNDEPIDCRACCEHFGGNAVDLIGESLCENPVCGDGSCWAGVEDDPDSAGFCESDLVFCSGNP